MHFHKYQGTGNDFILIDQREEQWLRRGDREQIARLCHRRFGIGADGLILLQQHPDYDFEMIYFNADGGEGSMCGNGGRCTVAFAHSLGMVPQSCRFLAIDGPHEARIEPNGEVALKMADVPEMEEGEDCFVLDTGSPHYVVLVEDIDTVQVVKTGQAIRYSAPYREQGINVNFVEPGPEGLKVATYERGVEDETLSCGTGVTASALVQGRKGAPGELQEISIQTKGGRLRVRFRTTPAGGFEDIWLIGPAERVFVGEISPHG